jgi:hypothetical protein
MPLVEYEVQLPSGSFEFTILGGFMTNVFSNLTNVVARLTFNAHLLSDGADAPALLINSHFDTPLDTEGAMDARAPIGVMLETARALLFSDVGAQSRALAVIFLFNGGEEVLQMASKGFIEQHRWAKSVQSVVNLDSVGMSGPEVLFQNGGLAYLRAYASGATRPHGSSLGADMFASGIIQSDTDYRIFADHAKVGIDLAFYRDSYAYHTRLDTFERMCDGCLQHEGDNVLGYTLHLLANNMLIDQVDEQSQTGVYFDIFESLFIVYSTRVALFVNGFALLCFLVARRQNLDLRVDISRILKLFFGVLIVPR